MVIGPCHSCCHDVTQLFYAFAALGVGRVRCHLVVNVVKNGQIVKLSKLSVVLSFGRPAERLLPDDLSDDYLQRSFECFEYSQVAVSASLGTLPLQARPLQALEMLLPQAVPPQALQAVLLHSTASAVAALTASRAVRLVQTLSLAAAVLLGHCRRGAAAEPVPAFVALVLLSRSPLEPVDS